MNVTCKVIGDLLPLYAEKMASEDTLHLVQTHLATCPSCREKARAMSGQDMQERHEIGNLPKLERKIRNRRKMAALFAFLVTASLLLSAWGYLMGPVYLTAEEADVRWYYGNQAGYIYYNHKEGYLTLPSDKQEGVSVSENGVLMLYMSPLVNRVSESRVVDPDTGNEIVTITASCRRIDKLFPKEPFGAFVHTLEADFDTLYYASLDGSEDTFLWGEKPSGGVQTLPRLVMGYYVLIAGVMGVILLWAAYAARKKPSGKYCGIAGCWLLCYVLSSFLISGGQWPTADSSDVPLLLAEAMVLASLSAGAILCGFKTWKMHKQEKID